MLPDLVKFEDFELDLRAYHLRRSGRTRKLERMPMELLFLLVEREGQLVTREEIIEKLWGKNVFLDTDNAINTAIRKIRHVLRDNPEQPRFIQTVTGRGYRFIGRIGEVGPTPVIAISATQQRAAAGLDTIIVPAMEKSPNLHSQQASDVCTDLQPLMRDTDSAGPSASAGGKRWQLIVSAVVALLVLFLAGYFYLHRTPKLTDKDTIVLADFSNTTGDPIFDGTLRQGLSVQLEQSPFLSLVSDEQVQQTLRMMGKQPLDAKLTPEIAREICQRTNSAAVLDGSIAQIGTQYLLTIKAVNCASGESVASTETQARDKNHVLDALDKTGSEIRHKLGESLSTVQKFDTPLEQATTSSLEALKTFSLGGKVLSTSGDAAAIPFYKRAIELDPDFALAYLWLGIHFTVIGESAVAAGYTRRAYELRDRTSEAERYFISEVFHKEVTGDIEQAEQSGKLWIQAYPRSEMPHVYLSGAIYPISGQYEKAVEEAREAIRLRPDMPYPYAFLMRGYMALDRLDDAKAAHGQALERKLDSPLYRIALYKIAFLLHDAPGMAQQVASSASRQEEDVLLGLEADTAGYSGRLEEAREFTRRARDSAQRAQKNEASATYSALSGLREALFGNEEEARRRAADAMAHSSGRDVQYGAALAFAYAGEEKRARMLTDDLGKRFPEDTLVQFNFLPAIRARLAIGRGKASEAVENLRAAAPYELGQTRAFGAYGWTALYPVFVRGDAYLAGHQGKEAAAEFQKILNHRGIVVNEPIGALAHLGVARAFAMQGDTAKAKAAYSDFLTLWKEADSDIPILKQAKAEYAKLQ